MKQETALVISNREVMPGSYLIWVDSPGIAAAQPGQFVMVRCGQETLLRRPLSIHRLTDEAGKAKLALLFNVAGKAHTGYPNVKPVTI